MSEVGQREQSANIRPGGFWSGSTAAVQNISWASPAATRVIEFLRHLTCRSHYDDQMRVERQPDSLLAVVPILQLRWLPRTLFMC
jgi:hypothetical protein